MDSYFFHYVTCDCNPICFRDEQLRAHWRFSSTRREDCAQLIGKDPDAMLGKTEGVEKKEKGVELHEVVR